MGRISGKGDAVKSGMLAKLDAMPIAERLTVMRAMSFAFPMLKNDRAWKVRIARAPRGGSDQIKKSPDGGGAQVGRLLRRTPPADDGTDDADP